MMLQDMQGLVFLPCVFQFIAFFLLLLKKFNYVWQSSVVVILKANLFFFSVCILFYWDCLDALMLYWNLLQVIFVLLFCLVWPFYKFVIINCLFNRSNQHILFQMKWGLQLSNTTVGGLLPWSSIRQTTRSFYQEIRSVSPKICIFLLGSDLC